jgi:hypothetical protein
MCSGSFRCSKPGLPLNDSSLRVEKQRRRFMKEPWKDRWWNEYGNGKGLT